ncbi:MAG: M48 family metallopeptidase [Clostridia bacterium]|nr:M48 family metallopeptidase [Clostridia bacterium]
MDLNFEVIRSGRKSIAIEIKDDGKVIIRAPFFVSDLKIEQLLMKKKNWILKHINLLENQAEIRKISEEEHKLLFKSAKENIPQMVQFYAEKMGVSYNGIRIKSQKTRWGSCSAKNNLNFNCLLMLCPKNVREYIVVHELCHLKELNHSKRFWKLVETYFPDYKIAKLWLKENGKQIISKI